MDFEVAPYITKEMSELKELKRPMVLTILPSTFLLNKTSVTKMNLAIHGKYVFLHPSQYSR